jgi:hypothetical protein
MCTLTGLVRRRVSEALKATWSMAACARRNCVGVGLVVVVVE